MARTEGILLDPVYSGKGFSGLIEMVKSGKFKNEENVLFLHTGGSPVLDAYSGVFHANLTDTKVVDMLK